MAASAKSRAALFQLSQIRTLPIRCELHQDQVLEASGQPRFSTSIAFGSQHAHARHLTSGFSSERVGRPHAWSQVLRLRRRCVVKMPAALRC